MGGVFLLMLLPLVVGVMQMGHLRSSLVHVAKMTAMSSQWVVASCCCWWWCLSSILVDSACSWLALSCVSGELLPLWPWTRNDHQAYSAAAAAADAAADCTIRCCRMSGPP
jgi:hypothetical protein